MELVQLEDHLLLDVPEIDSQHKELIAQVNGLHLALLEGADKATRDSLLSQLAEGMRGHFAYEEEWMERFAYPRLEAHKKEHDRLTRNLNELIERYHNGELVLSIAVVMEVKCWATIHIEKSDVPMGAFLVDQLKAE